MANGFIQTEGSLEIEEVGDDMFRELLQLSFFQDAKEDEYGNIITCKLHDLMHDLACSVMVDECSISEVGQVKDVVKTIRHLTVVPDSEQSSTVADCVMSSESSLRTLTFFEPINFHSFKFSTTLRVLNLNNMGLITLPESLCQLQHLRFLDLAWNRLESLLEFICRLRNLQMLDLSWNKGLTTLPLSIGTLQHLRYLDLCYCRGITSLPESTGSLKNLQRLNLSYNERITSLPVSIGNMESLRYLDLSVCENIRSLPESVGGLRNLESLILFGCINLEVLVKSVRNMRSLRHLDLQLTWRLREMPVGLGELTCLQTLNWFVVVADSECGGIKELHGLNQLRGELWINGLENVKNAEDAKEAKLSSKRFLKQLTLRWEGDESNNSNSKEVLEGLLVQPPPNLQTLGIIGYPGACFPQGIQYFTMLQTLHIEDCKNLTRLPDGIHLTTLQSLSILSCHEDLHTRCDKEKGDDRHLISHIPHITI